MATKATRKKTQETPTLAAAVDLLFEKAQRKVSATYHVAKVGSEAHEDRFYTVQICAIDSADPAVGGGTKTGGVYFASGYGSKVAFNCPELDGREIVIQGKWGILNDATDDEKATADKRKASTPTDAPTDSNL